MAQISAFENDSDDSEPLRNFRFLQKDLNDDVESWMYRLELLTRICRETKILDNQDMSV